MGNKTIGLSDVTVFFAGVGRSLDVLFVNQCLYAFLYHRYARRERYFRLGAHLKCVNSWRPVVSLTPCTSVRHVHRALTSCISVLCFNTFLDFIILTIAACRYNLRSSSTEFMVCSTSWGVSFCTAAVILKRVLLFEYSKLRRNTVSGVKSCGGRNHRSENDTSKFTPLRTREIVINTYLGVG